MNGSQYTCCSGFRSSLNYDDYDDTTSNDSPVQHAVCVLLKTE